MHFTVLVKASLSYESLLHRKHKLDQSIPSSFFDVVKNGLPVTASSPQPALANDGLAGERMHGTTLVGRVCVCGVIVHIRNVMVA